MKTSLFFLSAIAGASAFAPANQVAKSTQLAAAELDSLRGVGPETGGKAVRTHMPYNYEDEDYSKPTPFAYCVPSF